MGTANIFGYDSGGNPIPVNVDSIGRIVVTSSGDTQTKIDETDPNNVYVGESAPGTGVASALWKIKRINITGSITTVSYADSVATFTKIWNNRASYTYL